MNSFKTAVILAMLLGAAYWVYTSINQNPQASLPPGAPPGWSNTVDVELPPMGSGLQPPMGAAAATDLPAGYSMPAPGMPPAGGVAPPFGAPPTSSGVEVAIYAVPDPGQANLLPPPFPPSGYPSPQATLDAPPYAAPAGGAMASDAAPPAGVSGTDANTAFEYLMTVAQTQLEQGSLSDGLDTLSRFQGDPKFTAAQNRRLTELLDQVAGTVIFSRQHLLEPPHKVRPGETLAQIAQQYGVPAGLLAKINGVADPQRLAPGQELKVVRGPFDAVIDLDRFEMTLTVDGKYAGRFQIGLGRDCPQLEGTYVVQDKTANPTYYGRDQTIEADDPRNPLGERWIGLARPDAPQAARIGIHGTDNPLNLSTTSDRGTICLSSRDAEDVYDILSLGSSVVIRR